MSTITLGISAFYHDAAAAIVRNGEIIAAAQEERFTRIKADARFPINAINYCLEEAGIFNTSDITEIVFYDRPDWTFDRLVQTYTSTFPKSFSAWKRAMPNWAAQKFHIADIIKQSLEYNGPVYALPHHYSHAAAAFFPSPFEKTAILTIDGVGEWATASFGIGDNNSITILKEMEFPHSLGLLYSAFTHFCGFKVNSGEYKLMGLAPYGNPRYLDTIKKHIASISDDGTVSLNLKVFDFLHGKKMVNDHFADFFDGPALAIGEPITRREMDIAASIQRFTEEAVLNMTKFVKQETGQNNLCLSGGVALNCVANGKLLRENIFENIWIQPAAGDAGSALGAALAMQHHYHDIPRKHDKKNLKDAQKGSYLGPSYTTREVQAYLNANQIPYTHHTERKMLDELSDALASGNVVGLFQGRMEFGPRALGARSIIGDPRNPEMQAKMNLSIKYRESFRPFAPIVLAEDVNTYFDLDTPSPYMLLVANVKKELCKSRDHTFPQTDDLLIAAKELRSELPSITHWDYSARIQTVHKETNPFLHKVLDTFKQKTGYSVLINTSFNVRGEPIVCSIRDAVNCFLATEMDYLYIEGCWLNKKDMPKDLVESSRKNREFALD